MNKLLILIFTFFLTACMMPNNASGEDKVGQGEVVDLTNSKPKEGIVFAVCIFAVGEDGTKYLVDHRHAESFALQASVSSFTCSFKTRTCSLYSAIISW